MCKMPDQEIPSSFLKNLPTQPDYADLERRIADLEDRARREDMINASKERLKEMGLVFPNGNV